MRIKTVVLIAVAMMLAMVSTASAGEPFANMGTIRYENGTTFPYGCDCWMENLNATYGSEPWHYTSEFLPPCWDYQVTGEYEKESDYIHVWVESPDEKWFGENTAMFSEAWNDTWWIVEIHITMYEQAPQTDTFEKDLALGWNLISLPLAPTYSSTSAVLGNNTIAYDAVYRYDATSKQFVDVTTGTMDTGIGYFVHVTTAGIWEYEGTSETSTSTELKTGLNMIGVPNCTMSVDYAMGSVDYRYVARWDAADQEFEVYNPSAPAVFQHFNTMEPGEGYFVSAKSDYVSPPWEINCPI